jgi:hypothetical protein
LSKKWKNCLLLTNLSYYLRKLAMLWKLLFPTAIEIAKRHNSTSNRNAPPLSLCLHTTGVMIVIILVIGTIAMGLPLSPMLIQIAEATAEVPICNGIGPPTIVGTDNDDIIQGTEGNDLIAGLGGNDQIFGK